MSTLIRNHSDSDEVPTFLPILFICSIVIAFGAFLLAPGDLSHKAHIALHGLCAQRPSHSFQLGTATLPLDARMTGIYLGAAVTAMWLVATRRVRALGRPGTPVIATLTVFLLMMVFDGTNSLIVDLGFGGVYQPSNVARLFTGAAAGVSLGIALGHLFAITMWRSGNSSAAIVRRPLDLAVPVGLTMALCLLVLSGLSILYAPVVIGLMASALAVFAALAMVLLALATGRAWRCERYFDLRNVGMLASILAAVAIGGLSALRFLAERLIGLPQLT